jgi:hypothetical protein
LLQLWPELGRPARARASSFALAFAASVAPAVLLVNRTPFDPTRLAEDRSQLALLAVQHLALAPTFTLAGLAIVVLLSGGLGRAGVIYAADLVGAGLSWDGAEGVLLLVTSAGAAGAALLDWTPPRRRTAWRVAVLAAALVPLACLPWARAVIEIRPGPSKLLRHTLLDRTRFPGARLLHTEWNALARLDVVDRSARMDWTFNRRFHEDLPPQTLLVIDGDASTPIVAVGEGSLDFLDHTLSAAPLRAFRPRTALVIGAGGGIDVLAACPDGSTSNPACVYTSPTAAPSSAAGSDPTT